MRIVDLTGKQFGRLTVISIKPKMRRERSWLCKCACGNYASVLRNSLVFGKTRSCGCLMAEAFKRGLHAIHGKYHTVEYAAFNRAKNRCRNPNNAKYALYGGRGIEFRFCDINEFLEDVGRKPFPELQLDRIENNGHYEAGNVRWATRSQQMRNRRPREEWRGHGIE